MSKIKAHIAALAVMLLFSTICRAQELNFLHYSIDSGLSKNTIHSITHDSEGVLWAGTFNGLNRYDGYEFKSFYHDPADSTSLADNVVNKVITGSEGDIICCTYSGLSIFRKEKGDFINCLTEFAVNDAVSIGSRQLLVATEEGLFTVAYSQDSASPHKLDFSLSLRPTVLKRDNAIVYIGFRNGDIYTYSIEDNAVSRQAFAKCRRIINDILICKDSMIWVGTEGDGLHKINSMGQTAVHFGTTDGLCSNYVRSLESDDIGRLWIGTLDGLNIHDERAGTVTAFIHKQFDNRTLAHNSVKAIHRDMQNGIWLGSYYGGLNYWHPKMSRFSTIRTSPDGSGLNDDVTSCILEDKDGSLWVGTNKGGLNHITPDGKRIDCFQMPPDAKTGNISNDVKALYCDSTYMYIGAHASGLSRMDMKTKRIVALDSRSNNVYSLQEFDKDRIWVGTLDGLEIFDKRTQKCTQCKEILAGSHILSLNYSQEDSLLWVGAQEWTALFHSDTEGHLAEVKIEGLEQITYTHCFMKDSRGKMWIGSTDGLFCFENGGLSVYRMVNGLPSNAIHGIEEDHFGKLWLSTDKGLCCLNTSNGKTHNYFVSDGIQSNEFNAYSHCQTKEGRLYFGGIAGITYFDPNGVTESRLTCKPVFNCIECRTRNVLPYGELSFKHNENTLDFFFSVPDYSSFGNNQFSYILEGYDQHWSRPSEFRKASYTNLPKGKYRLLVKASNSEGIWCEEPAYLDFRIRPEWYNTSLALTLFILLGLAAVLGLIWYFLKQSEKDAREELNRMRIEYLDNISYELRTPLTLILAPIPELIAKSDDIWTTRQLKIIENNAKRLLSLSSELAGADNIKALNLKVSDQDPYLVVKEQYDFYQGLARNRGIRYTIYSNVKNRLFKLDEQCLGHIVNNILSNSFQHTKSTEIGINIDGDEQFLKIEVSCNGSGLSENDIAFARKLAHLHHGELTLGHTAQGGEQIIISIPQTPDSYSIDEIQNENKWDSEEEYEDMAQPTPSQPNSTVLIAESNEDILKILTSRLSSSFIIETARDGNQALDIIQKKDIAAIISEDVLPELDGIRLCQRIKQSFRTYHIPFILITSHNDRQTQIEAIQAGADDIVIKPFSTTLLIAKMKNMLRVRKLLKDNTQITHETTLVSMSFDDEKFMEKLNAVIAENIARPDFSTDDLAAIMNLSRSGLYLKVKSITGKSVLEAIHAVRFNKACKLLKEGKLTIAGISETVGFSSPSYFSTSFKKYFGCLPNEYRNNS